MTIKEQLGKLKENWLLIAIVIVILVVMSGLGNIGNVGTQIASSIAPGATDSFKGVGVSSSIAYPGPSNNFAPNVQDRLITKNSYMSSQVENGMFADADSRVKSIVRASSGYMLSDNANKYDSGWKAYSVGYYNIKVDAKKYDSVVSQLKTIGEVQSFNENAEDITGTYTDLQTQLKTEQGKLDSYKSLYNEATLVADKITLTTTIADEETTIAYLQNEIDNMDKQVSYSTISFTLTEKQSGYAAISFVKLSDLAVAIVGSTVSLIMLVAWIIPWAIVLWLIVFAYRKLRKHKK